MNQPNNFEEQALIDKLRSQVSKSKPINKQVIAYTLIGVGCALAIFMVAEVSGLTAQNTPQINHHEVIQGEINQQAQLIKEAEQQKQVSELRKQAKELELQALNIEDDSVSN